MAGMRSMIVRIFIGSEGGEGDRGIRNWWQRNDGVGMSPNHIVSANP
jgi:hypothetical protein